MNYIEEICNQILPPDIEAMSQCKKRWDSIAKPLGSLGKLEEGIIQIAGIQRTHKVKLTNKALIVMCGDNGVVKEGVTQTGQEVTAIVAGNFKKQKASVSIMARQAGVDVFPVDIGMAFDADVIPRKIAYGTKNMAEGQAMTRQEAIQGIGIGIDMVKELKEKGYQIIATGEMGIGNTTTSSAMAAVFLNQSVESVTGKGAGLTDSGLCHKVKVIQKAIDMNQPNAADPIDVLAKVGGFDIAGLVGVCLGGASMGIPIIMDGFISAVAALTAVRISENVLPYLLASHESKEPAGALLLQELRKKPYLTCDMCLGEGSGAVAVMPIIDMGLLVYEEMSTFDEIEIDAYQPL